MGTHVRERERCVRTFVELPLTLRPAIEDAIERLMELLDEMDGEPDIEPDPDFEDEGLYEPSLGALEHHPGRDDGMIRSSSSGDQSRWGWSEASDLEDEHDGREPDDDREPSLGSVPAINQWGWAAGEGGDREPELGASEDIDQINAWRVSETWVQDGEPSLGWTSIEAAQGYRGPTIPDRADLEIDAGEEPEREEDEPSLGASPCVGSVRGSVDRVIACVGGVPTVFPGRSWDQSYWSQGSADEREWDQSEGGEPEEGI